ncbi:MAG: phosphoenolpyruvate synthase [Bacteroidetes bacterium]|nr:phosphoenolpyruvate synthase [Bacteroidota bacterium]MBL7104609.1 phosphoenolpyruvate synthase [Bacteroidales bacterium]
MNTITYKTKKYNYSETSFNELMKKRIYQVLLISSKYDAFILEEDGRIDEQIFDEYVSLNLRYPPRFIQVSTTEQTFITLEEENIDLVIVMMSDGDIDTFELTNIIKDKYPNKPIVVLTPFLRKVTLKLDEENLNAIDYVFCWLGNADILLAIVKLIEDRMNAEHDILDIGVQAILIVEDSVRFYSSFLPHIYKIIFKQSKKFMTEGLNLHQQTLRMRGRPKILLATNYEEALTLYEKYKNDLLGIISDVGYKRNGELDSQAGIKFCEKIISIDKQIPILLQSSEVKNEKIAKELNLGFINKNSKKLSTELRNFIIQNFAFGDLVFYHPKTNKEIVRIPDLKSLQERLFDIPDETFKSHLDRNSISKWLNARALFSIADTFKSVGREDFNDLDEIRRYIFDTISEFRIKKGRGVIAKFQKDNFDEYLHFSRIGEGSIGGKARGLAFVDSLIKRNNLLNKFKDTIVTIPRTLTIGTDIFDEFMEDNNLHKIALSGASDKEILKHFIEATLPFHIHEDLLAFMSVINKPLAIRSSSLLEDSLYQPFAGIYSTYMIPNIKSDERLSLQQLSYAIKCVYASTFFKDSKAYLDAISNIIDEEKMGIVIQEVCGTKYGNKYYPTISGVARSLNFYPLSPEKPEDGIANIALGLGKYIVEGGVNLRFSPKYPKKVIQLSSPEMALRDTQKQFFALNLDENSFTPSTDDGINILKLRINEAEKDNSIKYIASTFDFENNMLRDGTNYKGKKLITFSNILNHNAFPLAEILQNLLDISQKEMNNPVEIEFAVNLNTPRGQPKIFNFLQLRPIVDNKETFDAKIDKVPVEETIIYSETALGNGIIDNVCDFIYVKPDSFNSMENPNIAVKIGNINEQLIKEKRNYVLVGPGRWGSNDPHLGIPVKWSQISGARVMIESGLENYRIDPSQGTHFFQNLTSFRVGYFTINPYINDGYYDLDYLSKFGSCYEDEFIRHIRFENPLKILIDGKKNLGVIFKVEYS